MIIVIAAAILIFRGIGIGLPSAERLNVELGGTAAMKAAEPQLRTFLSGRKYDRSEFLGLENRDDMAALSPYLDQVRSYHPDEQYILKTLSRMVRDYDWQPRSYIYPPFFFYQVGAGLAAGRVGGYLKSPPGTLALLERPDLAGRVYLIARSAIALAALAGIVFVFLAGRALAGNAVGLTAATLTAVTPLYMLAGMFIKPDIPCFVWSTLAMLFAIMAFRNGRRRDYLLAGLCVGLAAGSKYPGLLSALFPAGYFLARNWPAKGMPWRQLLTGRAWRGELLSLVLSGAGALGAFTLADPSWLFDRKLFFQDFNWISTVLNDDGLFSSLAQFLFCFAHDGLCYHVGVLLLPLLTAGLLSALVRPRRELLPLAAVVLVYIVMGSRGRPGSDAYVLPALAPLTVLAAIMLTKLRPLWLSRTCFWAAAASGLLYAAAIGATAARENVRLTASRWIQKHIPAGKSIGRYQYPVSYRTVMTPPQRYPTIPLLTGGKEALACDYFIVTSFEWEQAGAPWRARLQRQTALPPPPSPDYQGVKIFSQPPEILGCLPMRPRGFMVSPYLDTIFPVVVIYQKKGTGQHVQR